ncbi:hypothetical protein [Amycolatopsis jejuensis]|uniref:hypothetical protein n=1 Tax=Amycolatopsis jejuensis TaxID=330084 RepID=UPI0005260D57|nr:hypothetical protein [Amycolatopsis jejuensis]
MNGEVRVDGIDQMASAIAHELGDGWASAPGYHVNNHDAFVVGPAGERLHLRLDGRHTSHKGRLVVRGAFDTGLMWFQPDPGARYVITVAPTSSARRTAHEITRRLLPDYRPALREACRRHAAAKELRERRDKLMTQLARLLGGEVAEYGGIPFVTFSGASGIARIHDDETIELSVRLPDAQALLAARQFGTLAGPTHG